MVALLVVGAFVAGRAILNASEALPSGVASGTEPDLNGDIALRDIVGRALRLPGGREGVIVFVATKGCGGCAGTARRVDAAAKAQQPPLALTVVVMDPGASKGDFERFDREAGGLQARYALDDTRGSIADHFGVLDANTVLAYSEQGLTTGLIESGPDQVGTIPDSLAD